MARKEISRKQGTSSTGTPHSLLVEHEPEGMRFTVVGHDGKKRHAAVILPTAEVSNLLAQIIDAMTTEDK